MRIRLKILLYAFVFVGYSVANAGSYEDFFAAVQRNDAAAVSALLQRGFDPNTPDTKGQVGLFLALQAGNLAVAEPLLAHPGIQVEASNAAGETALMIAALKGHLAWCQRLLDRGALPQRPGWSPLHYAATGAEVKTVQLLLDRGADINAVSPNRSTPLMMAARYGSEASALLLLERGADVKRVNEQGLSAVDFARAGGRAALAERLAAAAR